MNNLINLAEVKFEREFKEIHRLLFDITSGTPEYNNLDEILEGLWARAEELGLDPYEMDFSLLEDAFDSYSTPDLSGLYAKSVIK